MSEEHKFHATLSRCMLKRLPIGLGVAIAIAVHIVGDGWWMDSADRVRTMLTVVAAAAFVVGITSPKDAWLPAIYFWIGFMAGMTVILFLIGPGTIWPIVLVIGGGMAGMVTGVGFVIGNLVRMGVQAVSYSK